MKLQVILLEILRYVKISTPVRGSRKSKKLCSILSPGTQYVVISDDDDPLYIADKCTVVRHVVQQSIRTQNIQILNSKSSITNISYAFDILPWRATFRNSQHNLC
jgi:hypothetical protein